MGIQEEEHPASFADPTSRERGSAPAGLGPAAERPAWRRSVAALSQLGLFILLTMSLWQASGWMLSALPIDRFTISLFSLFPAVGAGTFLLLRFPQPRSLAVIGAAPHRAAVVAAGWGVGVGAGLVTIVLSVHWALGWAEVSTAGLEDYAGPSWEPTLLLGLVGILVASAGEELLIRGYAFQMLARATHPWAAVAVTGGIFGWIHYGNPAFSGPALINTVLFGALFGLALVRHRTLWLPYGLHFGWNFALALFGANLSGLKIKLTAIHVTPVGPEIWTGGAYGPEAGLSVTVLVVVAAWVIWKLPLTRDSRKLLSEESQEG